MLEKSIINKIKILNLLSRHWILKSFLFRRNFRIGFERPQLEKHGNSKQYSYFLLHFFFLRFDKPSGPRLRRYRVFSITFRYTTLGRIPLDKRSARYRYIFTTTNNTHKKKRSVLPAGFEPAIIENYWLQTDAFDLLFYILLRFSMQMLWG